MSDCAHRYTPTARDWSTVENGFCGSVEFSPLSNCSARRAI